MKSPALPLAAAFACGGALTWLLRGGPATPVRDAEGSPARPAAPIRAEDGDVRTSLAAIETVVLRIEDRLRRFEEGAAVPPPERALLDAEPEGTAALAELATLMRALRDDLDERLPGAERPERPERLQRLRAANPDENWPALWTLVADWNAHPVDTERRMKLLTEENLLERYGSPTEMWSNEKGAHWIYGSGRDPDGSYATEVYFRLDDGSVTVLGVDP